LGEKNQRSNSKSGEGAVWVRDQRRRQRIFTNIPRWGKGGVSWEDATSGTSGLENLKKKKDVKLPQGTAKRNGKLRGK